METNSRRSFIKKLAIAGVVTAALPGSDSFALPVNRNSGPKKDRGLVFLFQGDSITDGNRGRNTDPNHIMGHGYAFSIASRLGADYPEKNLKFFNRGISGNKIVDLAARWQKDTLDLKPDVLSILIGINDTSSVVFKWDPVVPVEKYEEVYNSLLQQTKTQFPDIIFVLCEPFILQVGNKVKENWDTYRSDLGKRQEVTRELAEKYNAVFVDFQQVFEKACTKAPADYWIWDGIHPTVAGHELMVREWMKQVHKKLSFVK
jgi:lysophospholipase L1-like esterase